MRQQSANTELVWNTTDEQGDYAALGRPGFGAPDDVVALLDCHDPVWVTRDAARGLRDALNRLLGDDGTDSAYALHAAQHRQLAAAARRIAGHVDEHAAALARFAADRDAVRAAPPLVGMLLDVQRRSVADLGDLLDALTDQP